MYREGGNMIELKKCPFCGGSDGNCVELSVYQHEVGWRGIVECGCGAQMASYLCLSPEDAEADAAEEWNRRVET